MVLKDRIVELRKAKGQSQQDVADAVGVSKAHIWQLEKGHALNPTLGLVERLAVHFGVSVSDLIGESVAGRSADAELSGLFREAQKFDPDLRQLLVEIMKSQIKIQQQREHQRRKMLAEALLRDRT